MLLLHMATENTKLHMRTENTKLHMGTENKKLHAQQECTYMGNVQGNGPMRRLPAEKHHTPNFNDCGPGIWMIQIEFNLI